MLFTPASGGVKRYLLAKRAWLAVHRPQVVHRLVLPAQDEADEDPEISWVHSPALPLGNGYRCPLSASNWAARIKACRPSLIEAGDPYAPGMAALRVGRACDVPVIGFCHSDPPILAELYFGGLASRLARHLWIKRCSQFDAVLAPSNYMAGVLRDAGLRSVQAMPLGVDLATFTPAAGDRPALRARLGLASDERLLVFAGRKAPEKRIEVLVETVERLGPPYRLLLIGAGDASLASDRVIVAPFVKDPARLATLLAGCDAFIHANPHETFGLVVLEAMACGLPVAGPDQGGVGEIIDAAVGAPAHGADAAALADAVQDLFARDARLLGNAARTRAAQRHGWTSTFERLTGLYLDLTGDPRFTAPGRPPINDDAQDPRRPSTTGQGRKHPSASVDMRPRKALISAPA